MWNYNSTDTLCHYGVLEMKWGKRRQEYRALLKGHNAEVDKYLSTKRQNSELVRSTKAAAKASTRNARKEAVANRRKLNNDYEDNRYKEKQEVKAEKKASIKRGKELSKQLSDRSQIRWNEDYNERLISKMSTKDWSDVKNYERSQNVKTAVATALTVIGGTALVALHESKS